MSWRWRRALALFLVGYVVSSVALTLSLADVWVPGPIVILAAVSCALGAAQLLRLSLQFLDGHA